MFLNLIAPALGFLKRVPWQVWAVLAIVLTAWLWGNHRYSQGVESMQPKLALCEVKHGVTLSSLDKLEAHLVAMIEAGDARADAVADALAQSRETTDGMRGSADKVRAAAVQACETPDVILGAGL